MITYHKVECISNSSLAMRELEMFRSHKGTNFYRGAPKSHAMHNTRDIFITRAYWEKVAAQKVIVGCRAFDNITVDLYY